MFEFYFQRGDFVGESSGIIDFVKDLIVQIVGTGIGAWAAFSVYKAQRKDAIDKENKAKNDFEVDKLRYLTQLFLGTISFAQSFHKCLINVAEQLELDLYSYPKIYLGAPTDLRRIVDKIDREAFYHAYRNQLNDHQIQYLFSKADLLKEQYDTFMQAYMGDQPETLKLTKEIRRLVGSINDRISDFSQISDEYDDYRNKVDTWFQDTLKEIQQGKTAYDFMLEHLLLPILTDAPMQLKKDDPEFRSLLAAADECFHYIIQLRNSHRGIKQRVFELTQEVGLLEQSMSERIYPLKKFVEQA